MITYTEYCQKQPLIVNLKEEKSSQSAQNLLKDEMKTWKVDITAKDVTTKEFKQFARFIEKAVNAYVEKFDLEGKIVPSPSELNEDNRAEAKFATITIC